MRAETLRGQDWCDGHIDLTGAIWLNGVMMLDRERALAIAINATADKLRIDWKRCRNDGQPAFPLAT